MREYMANRRAKRRNELLAMAGNKCVECDETENLEFNHIDRSTKLFMLSGTGLDKPWKIILEEYRKCNLLCRTHHAEYTKKQWEDDQIITWNRNLHGDYIHGSARTYHMGCRCDRCKKAKRMYRNKECSHEDVVA